MTSTPVSPSYFTLTLPSPIKGEGLIWKDGLHPSRAPLMPQYIYFINLLSLLCLLSP
jgi:hypothetical protein